MNLFGRKPPTVSTQEPEPQLGFWQTHRKSVYLFGGCILLLLVSRALNSNSRKATTERKEKQVVQTTEREQSDKDAQIAQLHSQLFNAQRSVAAAAVAAQGASLANPLTPAQMQQLAAASGTGAVPPSALAGTVMGNGYGQASMLPRYYNSAETGVPRPSRPTTLVISYRQDEAAAKDQGQQSAPATPPAAAPAFPPYPVAPSPVTPVSPSGAASTQSGPSANQRIEKTPPNPEDQQHQLAAATGEKYRIREGTLLPCTEQLRINGFFAGNINCLISISWYSANGTRLLIPQGTVALGHTAAVGGQNQQRLFVVFDEFIMPDGYTVTFDNAGGTDQIGQTGLRDKVNHHYIQMFGTSVGLAAIAGLSQIGNYGNSAITAGSQYRAGVTQGLSESSVRILDKFTNILPTFTIREGARNGIYLPYNLWLPEYSKHAMPGDM